jgi:hypothetical protein
MKNGWTNDELFPATLMNRKKKIIIKEMGSYMQC